MRSNDLFARLGCLLFRAQHRLGVGGVLGPAASPVRVAASNADGGDDVTK